MGRTLSQLSPPSPQPSGGIEIIGEDGRTLFGIDLREGRILRIDSGNVCKHEGIMLDDRFVIAPIASNAVNIIKTEYKG